MSAEISTLPKLHASVSKVVFLSQILMICKWIPKLASTFYQNAFG